MSGLCRWSQSFALVALLWLVVLQAACSYVLLFICIVPEIDDDGLPALDEWILNAGWWCGDAIPGIGVCGLVLLGTVLVNRKRGGRFDAGLCVLFVCAGLIAIPVGVAGVWWLLPQTHVIHGAEKALRITAIPIFDAAVVGLVLRIDRRVVTQAATLISEN